MCPAYSNKPVYIYKPIGPLHVYCMFIFASPIQKIFNYTLQKCSSEPILISNLGFLPKISGNINNVFENGELSNLP